ncbi:hypothetical protein A3A09_02345 [Candidatus Nomurabacteria bacterium RIFCSPLOWO2_01_FULL_42_20]|nr:MAG: hypothetical protein A3A09_02345 [Candidatus Nomurabacteria bacterium RIFCSPLOWO2_01_FULL_42_20]
MKVIFTDPFQKDYNRLPVDIRQAFDKALKFFITNHLHPSLRTKKLPATNIWYARITRGYRFTFEIEEDKATLRRAGSHDILDKERRRW